VKRETNVEFLTGGLRAHVGRAAPQDPYCFPCLRCGRTIDRRLPGYFGSSLCPRCQPAVYGRS
jgi:hypothetical protein